MLISHKVVTLVYFLNSFKVSKYPRTERLNHMKHYFSCVYDISIGNGLLRSATGEAVMGSYVVTVRCVN